MSTERNKICRMTQERRRGGMANPSDEVLIDADEVLAVAKALLTLFAI